MKYNNIYSEIHQYLQRGKVFYQISLQNESINHHDVFERFLAHWRHLVVRQDGNEISVHEPWLLALVLLNSQTELSPRKTTDKENQPSVVKMKYFQQSKLQL